MLSAALILANLLLCCGSNSLEIVLILFLRIKYTKIKEHCLVYSTYIQSKTCSILKNYENLAYFDLLNQKIRGH